MHATENVFLESTKSAPPAPVPAANIDLRGDMQIPIDGPARIYARKDFALDTLTRGTKPSKRNVQYGAVIMLSMGGPLGISLETTAFRGNVHAVFIGPTSAQVTNANGCQVLRLSVFFPHPRYRALRKFMGQAVKPLPREAFAHLDTAIRQACQGRLSLQQASDLVEQIIDVAMVGAPPQVPADPRIRIALSLLAANIDYPFSALAAEVGLSRSRLSHLVHEELGISMRSCQTWMRMMWAWNMLVSSPELSMTEIAHTLKFADSSHLSRAFKRYHAISPTLIRDPKVLRVVGGDPLLRTGL